MKPFTLLIKPSSADCNLRCEYCFYLDRAGLYPENKVHRMSDEVLESLIKSYMSTNQPTYVFGWQGGEPTLMGLEFFEKVVALQKKYGHGKHVSNSLQTNGTLIDEDMAKFFKKHNFLLGISLDGLAEYHDTYRLDVGHKGTHHKVKSTLDLLDEIGVEYNILTLVNHKNVKHPKEVYGYLKENGYFYQQFIPCVEFDEEGNHLPFSITGKEWGQFLVGIFNCWIKDDTRRISIRNFDAIMNKMVSGEINMCTMGGNCCQYFVVEHNGDVYPCDFFVEKERRLGNLTETSWEEFQNSDLYKDFGKVKNQWPKKCSRCPYLFYCSGDCIKHRHYNNKTEQLSWLCEGWKYFYKQTLKQFRDLTKSFLRETTGQANPLMFEDRAYKESDICHCNSGKTYGQCHGK